MNGSTTPTSRPESNNNDISLSERQEDDKKARESDADESKNGTKEIKDEVESPPTTVRTTLVEALTAACGEKILNPDFLLQGGGQPFADQQTNESANRDDKNDEKLLLLTQSSSPKVEEVSSEKAVAVAESKDSDASVVKSEEEGSERRREASATSTSGPVYKETVLDDALVPKRPEITLYSQKMKGLKELLLGEKLNTHAISLQVTAQSQVQVGGKKSRHSVGSVNYATGTKRSRRE